MVKWLAACLFVNGCLLPAAGQPLDGPAPPDEVLVLKRNGGWCWYQDERALVVGEKLLIATVAGVTRDGSNRGDVQVTTYDMPSGEAATFTLAPEFQSDDHDVPALLALPDGRILASYETHGSRAGEHFMRWRITERPGDASSWGPERTADVGGSISYSNLFILGAEGNRIYNFHRCTRGTPPGINPNYMVSDDGGETFTYGGRLLKWPRPEGDPKFTGQDGGRPYLKYASDGVDAIHFLTTEDHPRAYDNSIYHGVIRGGQVSRSDGALVGPLGTDDTMGVSPKDLTRVFEGDADNVAWTIDLHLDADGNPFAVFSVQKDGAHARTERGATDIGQDHRFHYARFDGATWHVHEIAYAGTRLYPGEDDYTGLAAVHPNDPNTVFISTNADPVTGEPLISAADGARHREIFRGVTSDLGATWTWTAITRDSDADNLRPIVPIRESGKTALLWLRGTLRSYTDYDLDVVGLIER